MRCLKGTHVTQTIVTMKKIAGKERIERRKENVIVYKEMIRFMEDNGRRILIWETYVTQETIRRLNTE